LAEKLEKTQFLLTSCQPLTKKQDPESWVNSTDPDPFQNWQNVTDPQHWYRIFEAE
jgi:hypothetical protein